MAGRLTGTPVRTPRHTSSSDSATRSTCTAAWRPSEFQVFRHAPLAARGGRYTNYDAPEDQYHRNCVSANVVLFTARDDPNDRGDQRTREGLKSDHATWDQWLQIRRRYGMDVATITRWDVGEIERAIAFREGGQRRSDYPHRCALQERARSGIRHRSSHRACAGVGRAGCLYSGE